MKKTLALLFCVGSVGNVVSAMVVKGVDFPEQVKVGKSALLLNGVGVRRKFVFDVYAAALYLPRRSKSAESILNSNSDKQVKMVFLRDVSGDKIRDAWKDAFKANCKEKCDSLKGLMKKMQDSIPSVAKGDSLLYTFRGDEVVLAVNGEERGKVRGKGLSQLMLSSWIGKHPATESLKEGLLAGEDK